MDKKIFRKIYQEIRAREIKKMKEEISEQNATIQAMSAREAAIDDLLHDARKVNRELKFCVDSLDFEEHSSLEEIWAQSNLLSIIFKMYDVQVNTENTFTADKYYIPLYKRIEKVYKCLDRSHFSKGVSIKLNGSSYMEFLATDLIEVAFYTIIENAIKYAPEKSEINIDFYESKDTQNIVFRNLAILPPREELSKLTQRGYRGSNGVREKSGSGLGLHTFQTICDNLGIKFYFATSPKEDKMGEFKVTMQFKGCRNSRR